MVCPARRLSDLELSLLALKLEHDSDGVTDVRRVGREPLLALERSLRESDDVADADVVSSGEEGRARLVDHQVAERGAVLGRRVAVGLVEGLGDKAEGGAVL